MGEIAYTTDLVRLLDFSEATLKATATAAFNRGCKDSSSEVARTDWIMKSDPMRVWRTNNIPYTLLVNGNGPELRMSPLSFKTAELAQDLRTLKVPILFFFCGQETIPHGNPARLMCSLTAQLLGYYDFNLTHTRELDITTLLATGQLCTLFESLVMQLPHEASVFVLVDGITWFENEAYKKDMGFVVQRLHEIAKGAHALLKVLLMAPGRSRYVARVLQNCGGGGSSGDESSEDDGGGDNSGGNGGGGKDSRRDDGAGGGDGSGGGGGGLEESTDWAVLYTPAHGGGTRIRVPYWKGAFSSSLMDQRWRSGREARVVRRVRSLEAVCSLVAVDVGNDDDYGLE